jgi:hypothetical protein
MVLLAVLLVQMVPLSPEDTADAVPSPNWLHWHANH